MRGRAGGRIELGLGAVARVCLVVIVPALVAASAAPSGGFASPVLVGSDSFCSVSEQVNDDPGGKWQRQASIAVDGSGTAYAVWVDSRADESGRIYFSYRPPGGPWSADVPVTDESADSMCREPDIAVDREGNAYAVWTDWRNGAQKDIYFSFRPAGGSWGSNVRINDDVGDGEQWQPSIAVDCDGNAYAVWTDVRDETWKVYFSYRPAGGSWGANETVSDDPSWRGQYGASVGVDCNGNAYAVWTDLRTPDAQDLYSSYRPVGGNWGPNVKVNDDAEGYSQCCASIAVDRKGNAYAVWMDHRDGGPYWTPYFSYRPVGGSWGPNLKVGDSEGGCVMGHSCSAVGARGPACALWRVVDDKTLHLSYGAPGSAWTAQVLVYDNPSGAYIYDPALAVDDAGNAYAVWEEERDKGEFDIFFALCQPERVRVPLIIWQDAGPFGSAEPR